MYNICQIFIRWYVIENSRHLWSWYQSSSILYCSLTSYVIWEPLLFEVIELDDGNGAFMSRKGKRRRRGRRWRWRGGKGEEGRCGRRNEGGKKKFANGQQLVVYSFGHGFLDTGLDRWLPTDLSKPVTPSLPPSFSCSSTTTVDETGPVAHFPFVSHQLLLLIYSREPATLHAGSRIGKIYFSLCLESIQL